MQNSNDNQNGPDDPYLQVLIGIGSELAGIKRELQRYNELLDRGEINEEEIYECRCGQVLPSETRARNHAIGDHNAPKDVWMEMYE